MSVSCVPCWRERGTITIGGWVEYCRRDISMACCLNMRRYSAQQVNAVTYTPLSMRLSRLPVMISTTRRLGFSDSNNYKGQVAELHPRLTAVRFLYITGLDRGIRSWSCNALPRPRQRGAAKRTSATTLAMLRRGSAPAQLWSVRTQRNDGRIDFYGRTAVWLHNCYTAHDMVNTTTRGCRLDKHTASSY